jgi:hypothetical protein
MSLKTAVLAQLGWAITESSARSAECVFADMARLAVGLSFRKYRTRLTKAFSEDLYTGPTASSQPSYQPQPQPQQYAQSPAQPYGAPAQHYAAPSQTFAYSQAPPQQMQAQYTGLPPPQLPYGGMQPQYTGQPAYGTRPQAQFYPPGWNAI